MRAKVISVPDPFIMGEETRDDTSFNNAGNKDINAKTVRTLAINTGIRNLVLITAGQSNYMSVALTAFTLVNPAAIDNFNPYNGQMYAAADPLLGTGLAIPSASFGPGNVAMRVADTLVTNGKFDRVIIVPIAIGGTVVGMWGTGGSLSNRIPATMARLISRGITPGMTNVTFCFLWGQGESDTGTSAASYKTAINQVLASLFAAGFIGRAFINKQTWLGGVVNPTVQSAQWDPAVITGGSVLQGANADTLLAASRQPDNTHFNDAGMASLAALIVTALGASGVPY